MILSVFGTIVQVFAGSCLDYPDEETFGITKIESIEAMDDNGIDIKPPRLETFKKVKDLGDDNFLSPYPKLKINTMSFVWRWRIDDDEWNPKKMEFETRKIILPEGQIEVFNLSYRGHYDSQSKEQNVKSVVWTCEDGKWKKSKE